MQDTPVRVDVTEIAKRPGSVHEEHEEERSSCVAMADDLMAFHSGTGQWVGDLMFTFHAPVRFPISSSTRYRRGDHRGLPESTARRTGNSGSIRGDGPD